MPDVRVGEWSGEEQRKNRRVPLNVPIDCRGRNESVHGQATNISTSGLLVRCRTVFPQDEEVEVSFILPGSRERIEARARVAHVVPDVFMGLELIDSSPDTKSHIERYIAAAALPAGNPK